MPPLRLRRSTPAVLLVCAIVAGASAACSGDADEEGRTTSTAPASSPAPPVTVVAVGDIACGGPPLPAGDPAGCGYDRVARAVGEIDPDRLLLLGDIQYPDEDGVVDYRWYDRSFGDFRSISAPVPGDAEWVEGRDAYLDYFGDLAPADGYAAFDLGPWRALALNSADCVDDDGCEPGSPQYEWLRAELESADDGCLLAYWHDPRFLWVSWWGKDGEPRGPEPDVGPFWRLLEEAGADVVLGGNAHNYERWAPQESSGAAAADGITQFVVGTGGRRLNDRGPDPRPPTLAAFQDEAFGVLELTLSDGGYAWRWHSAPGEPAFEDEGSARCV